MEPEVSLPHPQTPANCLYLEPEQYSPWRVHKRLSLVLVLSQMNPDHGIESYFFKIHF